MGLVAAGSRLLGSLFGAGGRAIGSPAVRAGGGALAGGAAAGLGFSLIESLFGGGGNGVATSAAGAIAAPGMARRFVTLEDGSRVLVSREGKPMRAQFFLPAGQKLPGGALVVSVSPDGSLFGIRRGRRKRPAFKTEIETCKSTISAAKSLVKAAKG